MKKILSFILLIFIISLSIFAVGCDKEITVGPNEEPVYVLYYFDMDNLSKTTMEPISLQVGKEVGELPIPSDMQVLDGYYGAWFIDEAKTTLLSPSDIVGESITLYLGYAPQRYSVTLIYDSSLSFTGEFPSSYLHGEETPLPQINLGEGYQKEGKWVYGTGDRDYYTTAIPKTATGDLELTFVAQPIYYHISYSTGISDVEFTENDNPVKYNITMGTYTLKAPTVEGKVFKYWILKSTDGRDELNNTVITELSMDIFRERLFISLFAVWE